MYLCFVIQECSCTMVCLLSPIDVILPTTNAPSLRCLSFDKNFLMILQEKEKVKVIEVHMLPRKVSDVVYPITLSTLRLRRKVIRCTISKRFDILLW